MLMMKNIITLRWCVSKKGEVYEQKLKENVKQENLKRDKSKVNVRNAFQTINTWEVPTICYGEGIVQWTKEEREYLDRKTKKLITMHG